MTFTAHVVDKLKTDCLKCLFPQLALDSLRAGTVSYSPLNFRSLVTESECTGVELEQVF